MSELLFTKTLRCRVKDKHAKLLCAQAREVNLVWNFVNELSEKHTRRTGKFFSAYDLNGYTTGATKAGLSLHSQTVQAINEEFVARRSNLRKYLCLGAKAVAAGDPWVGFRLKK